MNNYKRGEKGAITLYVLLACLFFLFVLGGVYISNLNKLQVQEQQIKQIQENYAKDIDNIQEIYEDLQTNPIQIKNTPTNLVYNGKEQKWEPNVTDENNTKLIIDTDYEVKYNSENCIDAGNIEVTITGKGKYTGQLNFSYTIEKAKLKVKTGSKEKPYDGTSLTCSEITVDGFVNGETATYYTTGRQTDVGSSSNTYFIEFNGTAKAQNYEIIYELGDLTVNATTPIVSDTPVVSEIKRGLVNLSLFKISI